MICVLPLGLFYVIFRRYGEARVELEWRRSFQAPFCSIRCTCLDWDGLARGASRVERSFCHRVALAVSV